MYPTSGQPLSVTPNTAISNATIVAKMNPLRYRGYYYDTETGFYYLQSRYYDPNIGRFINADSYSSTGQGILGNNMYAYCNNNPVIFEDSSGCAVETVFDAISILISLADLILSPSWSDVGYLAWDIASVIIPILPGSYVAKGGKIGIKVASKIDDFVDGSKFLTGSYNKLRKLFKGVDGIEIHHLIEKRFSQLFNSKIGDFLSIPLTEELHQIITNRWRNLHKVDDIFKNFAYGSDYLRITYAQMIMAVKEVYRDMPEIMDEVLEWVRKNWRR